MAQRKRQSSITDEHQTKRLIVNPARTLKRKFSSCNLILRFSVSLDSLTPFENFSNEIFDCLNFCDVYQAFS